MTTPNPTHAAEGGHTPGPWSVSETMHPRKLVIRTAQGELRIGSTTISVTQCKSGAKRGQTPLWFPFTDKDWANLHLISAAPELLEACKYPRYGDTAALLDQAADLLDKQVKEDWSSFLTPHLRRAAEGIRAAIQKAGA